MKVYIGPYKSWFGPYQLAEAICFWAKNNEDKPRYVYHLGELLAHGNIEPETAVGEISFFDDKRRKTWLYNFLLWLDSFKKRKVKVRIDPWDTWSMDSTLSLIILPMLRQLKDTSYGTPFTLDEDVPEHLRSTAVAPKEHDWDIDDNHDKRWEWILDEMIFAFESKDSDWEDQFYSDNKEPLGFKKLEGGNSQLVGRLGDIDREGMIEYQKRITNGFRLFGKYYENLWD